MRETMEYKEYKDLSTEEKQARDARNEELVRLYPCQYAAFEKLEVDISGDQVRCLGYVKKDAALSWEDVILLIFRGDKSVALVRNWSVADTNKDDTGIKRFMLRGTINKTTQGGV